MKIIFIVISIFLVGCTAKYTETGAVNTKVVEGSLNNPSEHLQRITHVRYVGEGGSGYMAGKAVEKGFGLAQAIIPGIGVVKDIGKAMGAAVVGGIATGAAIRSAELAFRGPGLYEVTITPAAAFPMFYMASNLHKQVVLISVAKQGDYEPLIGDFVLLEPVAKERDRIGVKYDLVRVDQAKRVSKGMDKSFIMAMRDRQLKINAARLSIQ
jgi:hypothetical protein